MSPTAASCVFMSPPRRDWQLLGRANFRSQTRGAVDPRRAQGEWLTLARRIEQAGARVIALPSNDATLTGMPYAAESGHIVERTNGPLWLMPRMWAAHRTGEAAHWATLAAAMGIPTEAPAEGLWEGQGDVAVFRDTTMLFFGGRTDLAGMRAVRKWFSGDVLELEIREPAFHGNMALLPLEACNAVLACRAVIEPNAWGKLVERFGKDCIHEVSEDEIRSYATNGLPIGKLLLAPHLLPARVQSLVEELGMTVECMDMSELCEKAGGASRCLVHVARLPEAIAMRAPQETTLAAIATSLHA